MLSDLFKDQEHEQNSATFHFYFVVLKGNINHYIFSERALIMLPQILFVLLWLILRAHELPAALDCYSA